MYVLYTYGGGTVTHFLNYFINLFIFNLSLIILIYFNENIKNLFCPYSTELVL